MAPPPHVVRAAVVPAAPIAFNVARTLEKVEALTSHAASQGAKLIVFPEARVRLPAGFHLWRRGGQPHAGRPRAVPHVLGQRDRCPGPRRGPSGRNRGGKPCSYGHQCGGSGWRTLYCTVLFFASDGRYLGKHRKLMPTASERLVWGFGDGSTLPVFETPLGRLGAVICWENYMPLLRMAMYAKGIQLYCAPTADARDTWIPTVQYIALEGRCFVLSCNQFCRRSDYPLQYETPFGDDQDTVIRRGGSCIVDPLGQIIAGPDFEGETILCAGLDMGEIAHGTFDFDVVGHYARPDMFRLHVNAQPQPVSVVSAAASETESE